jgi:hypothetical protein
METGKEFTLVRGIFSPEESMKLLYSLFDYKINYHHMELFSLLERIPAADGSKHEGRLAELKAARAAIGVLISEAKNRNADMHIRSQVTIELTERQQNIPGADGE